MIIPKNTKLKNTIWKSYTLKDMLFAIISLAGLGLIMKTNLPGKWIISAIYFPVVISLFIPTGNEQLWYNEVIQMFRYLFSKRVFSRADELTNTKNENKFNNSKSKKGKSKREKTIDEIIPYTDILANGTIVYPKYYGRAIEVDSKEFGLQNDYNQDIDIMGFSNIFKTLDISQTIDIVKIDRPMVFDSYIRDVLQKIKENYADRKEIIAGDIEDTKKKLQLKSSAFKLEILSTRLSQLEYLNSEEKVYKAYYYIVAYDIDKQGLEDCLGNIQKCLNKIKLDNRLLDKKQTAIFLKYCNTRNFNEREIDSFPEEKYLDWIKPNKIKFKVSQYEIDDVNAFTYAISDYPVDVDNAWGAELMNIDNTKVVVHIQPVAQNKAVSRVDKVVNELFSREDLPKASQQLGQETHIETMKELLVGLQNDNESFADINITVTGFNYDSEENYTAFRKRIRNEITTKGFQVETLWYRQLEGFITCNISKRSSLKFLQRGVPSTSLAGIFPFVHTSIMEEGGVLLGENNYPFIFNIWKRSATHQNSNMFVVGKSGAGKSYFMKSLMAQLFADNTTLFILDPENEYTPLCYNLGGKIVDVGNATQGRLNPFHIYQILTENGMPAPPSTVFYAHLRTLESFLKIVLESINQDCLEYLNNYIVEMYEAKGITPDTDVSNFSADKFPVFEDLVELIRKKKTVEKNELIHNELVRIEMYVQKFAKGGRYSDIWNGPSTLEANDSVTVFNFQSLFSAKNNIVANAQMLLVFRYLEQTIINIRENNRQHKKKHVAVCVDEAHMFIDPKYMIALDFFQQMIKRIRKYDGAFIPTTQSIADWTGNEELLSKSSAIIKLSQYNIIMGLQPSDCEDVVKIYRAGAEINEIEQNLIINAERGEAFFIGASNQRSHFQVQTAENIQEIFTDYIQNEEDRLDKEFFEALCEEETQEEVEAELVQEIEKSVVEDSLSDDKDLKDSKVQKSLLESKASKELKQRLKEAKSIDESAAEQNLLGKCISVEPTNVMAQAPEETQEEVKEELVQDIEKPISKQEQQRLLLEKHLQEFNEQEKPIYITQKKNSRKKK